ncbi:hypothetical protein [Mycobacterium sp. 663a-19]|uniref:hypothetical protein n=1 Tax=Mycobacterium sp. 663a-19 TaxID=2986148 RepID=UPI002D76F24B|nr:hypothetical protein [Mycobacterium sp. 663a-19]
MSTRDSEDKLGAAEATALAELADAEAAEAEAKAAAARARARAIKLRRQAEDAEAAKSEMAEPAPGRTDDTEASDTATVEGADGGEQDREGDAQATTPAPAMQRRRWLRLHKWTTVLAALAVASSCAFGAVIGVIAWQHHNATQQRQRTAEFASAARQTVFNLMSLDFHRAKEDVQRIIDSSTGDFKKDFERHADDFVKVAQESKVVTTATVTGTAVQSISDNHDSGVVLVAAQTEVTNAAGAKNEQRNWRLSVTVTRDGGLLKMSKVEFVP